LILQALQDLAYLSSCLLKFSRSQMQVSHDDSCICGDVTGSFHMLFVGSPALAGSLAGLMQWHTCFWVACLLPWLQLVADFATLVGTYAKVWVGL
jgi:hypothetical protein